MHTVSIAAASAKSLAVRDRGMPGTVRADILWCTDTSDHCHGSVRVVGSRGSRLEEEGLHPVNAPAG